MNIHDKLSRIQAELKAPKKETNSFGGYKYRTIDGIFEAVKPLLGELNCSLKLTDEMILIGDRYYVRAEAVLTDSETLDFVSTYAWAREPVAKKGADDSQITGSATTYARKYALTGLFLLDNSENDPDSEEYQKKIKKNTAKEEKETKTVKDDPERKAAYEDFKGLCAENGLSAAAVAAELKLSGKSSKEEFEAVTAELKKLIASKADLSKWRAE